MKYGRGLARPRPVMASCRNRHGVRVYIPLKGKTGERKWVKPIRFSVLRIQEALELAISFRQTVEILLRFSLDEMVFFAPFSLAMMEGYGEAGAAQREARGMVLSGKLAMVSADQDIDDLEGMEYETVVDAVDLLQADLGRPLSKEEVAQVIVSVGAGKWTVAAD